MKSNLSKILLTFLLATVAVGMVNATDFTVDGLKYTTLTDSTVKVSKNSSNTSDTIIVPSEVKYSNNTYKVVSIYDFESCRELKCIILPSSITEIGYEAFLSCSGLLSIDLSQTKITSIGKGAFSWCGDLTTIKLPNTITSVGEDAFFGCGKLTKVIVPNFDAAAWCNIDFAREANADEYSCFESNPLVMAHHLYTDEETEITNLSIPEGVTTIKTGAFRDLTDLTSIDFPKSLTSIGSQAFYGCTNLKKVTACSASYNFDCLSLSSSYYFWEYRKKLETLIFPKYVTPAGSYACSTLRDVYAYYNDPPITSVFSYDGTFKPTSAILHVPKGRKAYYQARADWNKFTTIMDDIEDGISAEGLVLDKSSLILEAGKTAVLNATVTPDNASTKAVKWTSSDEKVATVDDGGTVLGVAPGTATITATTTDGTNLSASCQVTVAAASQPAMAATYEAGFRAGNLVAGVINEETLVPFTITNSGKVTAFSATIKLPAKLQPVGEVSTFAVAAERGSSFGITSVLNQDSTITITGKSTGEGLEAGDGAVVNLKVTTNWQNTYEIPVTAVTITTDDGTVKTLPDSTTRLIVTGKRGDMNGDGKVDATDALYIYNMVMGFEQ